MGHNSFLVGWDPDRGVAVKPELEAKNCLPLLWMAMFDPDDVRDATVDGAAFAKPPNATEKFEDTTYAYCDGPVALARLKARIPVLGAVTNETLASKFLKFAQVYAPHAVVLRLTGLADAPVDYVRQLRESLTAVADPATPPERLRRIGGLAHGWESKPGAENLLVGWGTLLTAREREATKQKKASTKGGRVEKERLEHWRTAIAQQPAENRKPYGASSTFAVGDLLDHVKFGPGTVVAIVEKTKIEVQFEDGMHVLVHKPGG